MFLTEELLYFQNKTTRDCPRRLLFQNQSIAGLAFMLYVKKK